MFDKLVESTNQRRAGRTGRYFLTTTLIYAAVLTLLSVATVFWFNPALAEAASAAALLAPPPVPAGPPPQADRIQTRGVPRDTWAAPTTPPERIADARTVPPRVHPVSYSGPYVPGVMSGPATSPAGPVSGANGNDAEPPPLPLAAPPKPTVTPTPEPQHVVRMTSSMLAGKAIKRVQPPYPAIARQVQVSGMVQVQVMISEDGRVEDADVLSGHPLLREAARQAARQWVFSPTVLNGKPVRVTGVITFNFMLN